MFFSSVLVLMLSAVQILMLTTNAGTQTVRSICSGNRGSIICGSTNSSTIQWSGSVFSGLCPDQNDSITVTFPSLSVGESVRCGTFVAVLTSVNIMPQEIQIRSELVYTADVSLNGTEVICSDTTTAEILRNIIFLVNVSPGYITVAFNHSDGPEYTIDWSPLTDVPLDLASTYDYFVEVEGNECGCSSQTLPSNVTSLVCSGWEANGQLCTISVKTRNTDGSTCPRYTSSDQPTTVSILLQSPETPNIVKILPVYSVDGFLEAVEIQLYDIEDILIEINRVPGNFIFTYTHSSGETCKNVIPVSECLFRSRCRDENIHSCPFSADARMSGTLTLTIVAENVVGQSQPTVPTTFSSFNEIYIPHVNLAARAINCQLYEIQPSAYGQIRFNSFRGCIHLPSYLSTTTSQGSVSSLELRLPDEIRRKFTYCYTVVVNISAVASVTVEGRFRLGDCDPKELGSRPYYETDCGKGSSPYGIAGGIVCYNGTTVGSNATYSCLNCGWTLLGSDTRQCITGGTWSGSTPRCACHPELPPPPSVKCAYFVQNGCVTAAYTDNSDAYELVGNTIVTFNCTSGRWSDPPSCEESKFTSGTIGIVIGVLVSVLFLALVIGIGIAIGIIFVKASPRKTLGSTSVAVSHGDDVEMSDSKEPVKSDEDSL